MVPGETQYPILTRHATSTARMMSVLHVQRAISHARTLRFIRFSCVSAGMRERIKHHGIAYLPVDGPRV